MEMSHCLHTQLTKVMFAKLHKIHNHFSLKIKEVAAAVMGLEGQHSPGLHSLVTATLMRRNQGIPRFPIWTHAPWPPVFCSCRCFSHCVGRWFQKPANNVKKKKKVLILNCSLLLHYRGTCNPGSGVILSLW